MKHRRLISIMLILALAISAVMSALAGDVLWQRGDKGDQVDAIKDRLRELGYLSGLTWFGFDGKTEEAVKDFQRDNGLLATGMVDQKTYDLLFSPNARAKKEHDRGRDYEMAEESGAAPLYMMAPSYAAKSMANTSYAAMPEPWNTNEYTYFQENGFQSVASSPFSTFAADVDTASYAQLRRLILSGERVPADAVRIEEMLNYFHYDYAQP